MSFPLIEWQGGRQGEYDTLQKLNLKFLRSCEMSDVIIVTIIMIINKMGLLVSRFASDWN